jgi:pteridine reductase
MPPLNRRVALVTGAGKRRIGYHIARHLAENGFDLALHYRSAPSEAETIAYELRDLGARVVLLQGDLSIERDVLQLGQDLFAHFSEVHLVVHCASSWLRKSFEDTGADDLFGEFGSNVVGTFLISKLVGLRMKDVQSGVHIVTIGDWAIDRPYRDHAAYLLSKGTVPTLTKVLAVELGTLNPSIRVNCLALGPILIPTGSPPEVKEEFAADTLVRRIGDPVDVARLVLTLTESEFITGTVIYVDGGRSIFAGVSERGNPARSPVPTRNR